MKFVWLSPNYIIHGLDTNKVFYIIKVRKFLERWIKHKFQPIVSSIIYIYIRYKVAEYLEVHLIGLFSKTCEIRGNHIYLSDLVHALEFFWLVLKLEYGIFYYICFNQ